MKQSIVAQQIAQEFILRPGMHGQFDLNEVAEAVYDFLGRDTTGIKDEDSDAAAFLMQGVYEDRAACLRLAFGRSPSRIRLTDIIATAQRIMDWPEKASVVAPIKKTTASKKPTTRKKAARRTGS